MDEKFKNLLVEQRGHLCILTIHRPEVHNALNSETLAELDSVFEAIGRDERTRAVILTGAGTKSFVSGADISELAELAGDPLKGRAYARRGRHVLDQIESATKPVIAAVNGYALGGGCELALACTLRVAAGHAKLGLPEVGLGILPGFAGTQRLPRLVGRGRALDLLLTGRRVDAEEALQMGLVNRVVPGDELLDATVALAEEILTKGPLAVRACLEAVRNGLDMSFGAAGRMESDLFGLLCSTWDMGEGMRAFLEKRRARFEGR